MSLILLLVVYMFSFTTIHCQNTPGMHPETLVFNLTYHPVSRPPNISLDDYFASIPVHQEGFYQHDEYFVAIVDVGYPRVRQKLVLDTGSDLTWIKCNPCCSSNKATYEPVFSASATELRCTNQICRKENHPSFKCGENAWCKFKIEYGNRDTVEGHIFKENFRSDNNVLDTYVLGCGDESTVPGWIDGILGLAHGKLSIVEQRGSSKFGYCLARMKEEVNQQHSRLIIGKAVQLVGSSTPLIYVKSNPFYYVGLQSIRLGDELLDIDPEVFKIKNTKYGPLGGVIMDTGGPYSYLQPEAIDKIVEKVTEAIKKNSNRLLERYYNKWFGREYDWNSYRMVCFMGEFETDLKREDFPKMTLVFDEDATIVLKPYHIFKQFRGSSGSYFCLSIIPNRDPFFINRGMLGSLIQKNLHVAYDLAGRRIWFQSQECDLVF